MKNIAIFASGNGSNAERIITYFRDSEQVTVPLILTNNPRAGVLDRAKRLGVESLVFDRATFRNTGEIVDKLKALNIDMVVLAGFLWLVPKNILNAFPGRVINIHPALLPKYGGKGMYGSYVHEAVVAAKEPESGITIHEVNEIYDDGQIIFQAKLKLAEDETPDSLAARIHELEYEHFPKVISELLKKL